MKRTITFNDKRNFTKKGRNPQNIRLEIIATGLPGDCSSFTVDITDAPHAPEGQNPGTIAVTLEEEAGKPETCTFPLGNAGEYEANWISHIETVASDAPMEYSEEPFSVCDTLNDMRRTTELSGFWLMPYTP